MKANISLIGKQMLTPPHLTTEDLAAFERDGFLVKRSGFSADDMNQISTWTDEVLAMPEVSGRHWVYHEESRKDGSDLVNRIENIAPFHTGFGTVTEALKAPVAQLLGEQATLFKEKINFKMPGGGGFAPHQDSQAGWDTYADFFISALISIDRSTLANGCLQLAAGHHKAGIVKSWEPLNEKEMMGMSFEPVSTEPGDIVFFDCFAPHASESNMSDNVRRIYYATYNRASAGDHMTRYYADKHRNFPPDIDRDPDKEYIFRV